MSNLINCEGEQARATAAVLKKICKADRAAEGNRECRALQERGRSDRFVLIEAWRDAAAQGAASCLLGSDSSPRE